MNGKQINAAPCTCGGYALRVEQGDALGLRCGKCGRQTSKTKLRTEAAFDALTNEWNNSQPAK
jgi:hypothetical protein